MKIAVLTREQTLPVGSPIFTDDHKGLSKSVLALSIDSSDFAAMKMAVQLKQLIPGTSIGVFYLGQNKYILREILAAGADESTILKIDNECGALEYARRVAEILREGQFDFILTGQQGAGADGLGPAIACYLDSTLITSSISVEPFTEGRYVATRTLGRGRRQKVVFNVPAFVMCDRTVGHIAYSTLPNKMKAAKLSVKEQAVTNCQRLSERVKLQMPTPRPKKIFTPDSKLGANERLKQILSGGVTKRSMDKLEGEPKDIAKQLTSFLKKEVLK